MSRLKTDHQIIKDPYKYKDKIEMRYRARFFYEKADGTRAVIQGVFRTKTEANDFINDTRAEHAKKGTKIEHRKKTLAGYLDDYEKSHIAGLAHERGEPAKMQAIREFFGEMKLDAVRRSNVLAFKQYLIETPYKEEVNKKVEDGETGKKKTVKTIELRYRKIATVNRYLARLRHILNEAAADGLINPVSFKRIIENSLETKRKTTINYVEFNRLLAACDVERSNHDRKPLKLVLLGLWNLGCRVSELQQILVSDLSEDLKTVKVWTGKRKQPEQRICYISAELRNALKEADILSLPPETKVFAKPFTRTFSTAKKIAGINEDLRLNDLRHCFITNALNAGISLPIVQKQVGHTAKSAMTLDVYHNPQAEEMIESMQDYENFSRIQAEKIIVESQAIN
jgi:integrase